MLNSRVTENIMLDSKPMTIQGAVNKTVLLLMIVAAVAVYAFSICAKGFSDRANLLTIVSAVLGFILAIVTVFKPQISKITAPAYAICEGFFVGTISFIYYSAFYPGIIAQAASITILTLFSMLLLYKLRIIQATPLFRKVIFVSTAAIAIFYLITFIASLFHVPMVMFNGSPVWIIASIIFCAVAAFNFILDFDFIERGEQNHLPDYFEWYGGFSLLVTIVWLYIEVLKLLAQLSRRN